MKTKRIGFIAVLTAVLLISAVLVTTCFVEPVDTGGLAKINYTPSPGMGYIVIKSTNPRTLFPDTLGILNLSNFEKFDIIIYNTGTTTAAIPAIEDIDPADFTSGVLDDPIEIAPGFYDVVVLGYAITPLSPENTTTTPSTYDPIVVAFGMDSNVEVEAGNGGSAIIILKEIVDGEGDGLFSYNLSLPPVTTAVMSFTPLSGQTTTPANINLHTAGNNPDSIELASGYWRVITTLTLTGSQTMAYRETVHIYEGFETKYGDTGTPVLFPALNNMTYAVTFYDWDDDDHFVSVTHTGVTVLHGDTLDPDFYDPEDPVISDTYTEFDGWYTKDGSGGDWGDLWADDIEIWRPLSLYAKWSEPYIPTLEDLEIEVTVNIPSNVANVLTDIVLDEDDTDISIGILVIDITNYSSFSSINWYHNNVSITTPITSNGDKYTIDGTTSTLTIDFNEFDVSELIDGVQVFTAVGDEDTANERTNYVTVTFSLP